MILTLSFVCVGEKKNLLPCLTHADVFVHLVFELQTQTLSSSSKLGELLHLLVVAKVAMVFVGRFLFLLFISDITRYNQSILDFVVISVIKGDIV